MKKTILYLLFLLAIFRLQGQTLESATLSIPSGLINIKSSLVRSDEDKHVIAYNENLSGNEFQYIDNINPVRVIQLNSTMNVEDFQILHDTIYFCGSLNNKGLMGYFALQEFFSPFPQITYCIEENLNTIIHMVAFNLNTPGDIRLVAVGLRKNHLFPAYEPEERMIIDCSRVSGLWSKRNFGASGLNSINNWLGAFTDITVTDNYVVTIGPRKYAGVQTNGEFLICRMKKYDLSAGLDWYTFNTNHDSETASTMEIEHLKNDDVATAVLDISNTFGTIIRTFEMNNMTNIQSQRLQIVQKNIPLDLQYVPDYGKLLLLQNDEITPSNIESFVYVLDPYAHFPYHAISYFVHDMDLTSLDCYAFYGILAAGSIYGKDAFFYKHLGFNPVETCYKTLQVDVDTIPARYYNSIPLTFYNNQISWIVSQATYDEYDYQIDCYKYQ